jgi:hypothetical protein
LFNDAENMYRLKHHRAFSVFNTNVDGPLYIFNGMLLIPIESIWESWAASQRGFSLRKENDIIILNGNLEDGAPLPEIKIDLTLSEFASGDETYTFESWRQIEDKTYISADFFVKAYDWQIMIDNLRYQFVTIYEQSITFPHNDATFLINAGSHFFMELTNQNGQEHEWQWRFNINPKNGLSLVAETPETIVIGHAHLVPPPGSDEDPGTELLYEDVIIYEYKAERGGTYEFSVASNNDVYKYSYSIHVIDAFCDLQPLTVGIQQETAPADQKSKDEEDDEDDHCVNACAYKGHVSTSGPDDPEYPFTTHQWLHLNSLTAITLYCYYAEHRASCVILKGQRKLLLTFADSFAMDQWLEQLKKTLRRPGITYGSGTPTQMSDWYFDQFLGENYELISPDFDIFSLFEPEDERS